MNIHILRNTYIVFLLRNNAINDTIDEKIFHSVVRSLEKIKNSVPSQICFYGHFYDMDEFLWELENRTEVGLKIYEMYVSYRNKAANLKSQ